MIRLRGTVEYEGGHTDHFEAGSAILVAWELYARRHDWPVKVADAPQILANLVIAHAALGVEEGFEVWRKSVVDIEVVGAESVPPTLPEPSLEA